MKRSLLSVIALVALGGCYIGGCYNGEPFSEPIPIPIPASYAPQTYATVATTQRVNSAAATPGGTSATTGQPAPQSQPVVIDDRAREQIVQAAQQNVLRRFGVDKTQQVNDYLILVGSLVTINTPKPELEYTYVLLDTEQPLHFGLAPRTIYISRGSLRQMEDESELAGVIAREISNLLAGRALRAAGIPVSGDAATTSPSAATPTTGPMIASATNTSIPPAVISKYGAKLTDVLLKDGLGSEQEQAADVEGAKFAAAARYAPDGFLRLLTRQKSTAGGGAAAQAVAWERIKALDANVQIVAKAYPAADVRLPVRFDEYVRPKKAP